MEDLEIYWIWLQEALGYGSPKVLTVKRLYDKIEDFYNSNERDYKFCGCFTPKELQRLSDKNINKAIEIRDKCLMLGYKIITYDSNEYPKRLKHIDNPPCVLYVWGDLDKLDDTFTIAIVGTRNATNYGLKNAYDISYNLAKCGTVIVSGGALGIDSSSHKGALQAEGKTICVLGCGLDYKYLQENETMREVISKNGAVISEYQPGTPPIARNFPMRNRIISGLSLGVVVVEAGEKSGSLITANIALEQNREVFALMGSVYNNKSTGTNYLIKNNLATAITDFKDVLREFDSDYIRDMLEHRHLIQADIPINNNNNSILDNSHTIENTIQNEKINNNKTQSVNIENKVDLSDFSDEAKKVYECVTKNESIHIDDIKAKSNLPINIVLQCLTELELFGLINAISGRRYIRI